MFLLPHGKITSLLYIMKKPKQNIILHANKNIEHSHSNMVIHRIAQSKSYVENIDEYTPQGARYKPSFSLITHIQLKSLICILIFPTAWIEQATLRYRMKTTTVKCSSTELNPEVSHTNSICVFALYFL